MNNKQKRVSGMLFLLLLLLGMIGGIILPDQELSNTERRTLAQLPEFSWEQMRDSEYSDELETYLLEQFPGRDIFRMIKTEFDTWVLGKTDSSGYVKIGNHILEIQTSYDESQVTQAGELFQNITSTYFEDSNVYYGVIPDKTYFVDTLPQYDYENVDKTLADTFAMGIKIELADSLGLDDYFYTDLHAKQVSLIPLANQLLEEMNAESDVTYHLTQATEAFYGGYSGNSAYYVKPDSLYYLENDMTQNALVYDYESNAIGPIYTLEKLGGMDDYDIFLGGARALLTIQNTQIENGKKLIVFRDSFGSAIAPLLLSGYEEITLVDLRYVSADYAMQLLEERSEQEIGQGVVYDDVLFLYHVEVLYNSNSMKR